MMKALFVSAVVVLVVGSSLVSAQDFGNPCGANTFCNASIPCAFGACISSSCTIIKDLQRGSACNALSGVSRSCFQSFCDTAGSNQCTALKSTGETCASSSQCKTGSCINTKCVVPLAPGDTCPSDASDCRASSSNIASFTCTAGKCAGAASGGTCCFGGACTSGVLGCEFGQFCTSSTPSVSGTCSARIKEGQTCTTSVLDPNQCEAPTICVKDNPSNPGTTGKCIRIGSIAAGGACGTSDRLCAGSDNGDLVCRYGICTEVSDRNVTTCGNSEGCGLDGYCDCTGGAPVCKVPKTPICSTENSKLMACLQAHKCNGGDGGADYTNVYQAFKSGTCINKCKTELVNYECCRGMTYKFPSTDYKCPLSAKDVDAVGLGIGIPLFFIILVVSLAILCEIPQQQTPTLWLAACWWHWWDDEIEYFIKKNNLQLAGRVAKWVRRVDSAKAN